MHADTEWSPVNQSLKMKHDVISSQSRSFSLQLYEKNLKRKQIFKSNFSDI